MHANMPLGSRPDFTCHTVVESRTSSTFDVAFCIIENNWIPSPPSAPPCLSRARTNTHRFCPRSLWARYFCEASGRGVVRVRGVVRGHAPARKDPARTAFQHRSRVILQVGLQHLGGVLWVALRPYQLGRA